MDSSVIDAMAGCHGNGGSTEGSYSTLYTGYKYELCGQWRVCLLPLADKTKI